MTGEIVVSTCFFSARCTFDITNGNEIVQKRKRLSISKISENTFTVPIYEKFGSFIINVLNSTDVWMFFM